MKKKLLFLLMPLLLCGMTGCVRYNGQGKPSKSSSSQKEESSISSSDTASEDISSDVSSESGQSQDSSDVSSESDISSSEAPVSSSEVAPESDELPKGTEVTLYLVFGANGLYQNEEVDDKIPELFLEHVMEYKGKVGDLLPTDKEVTSSVKGSKFAYWTAYNNDGKLTNYIKVPGYDKKILYAYFFDGKGGYPSGDSGEVEPVTPPTPAEYTPSSVGTLPASGYGFKFGDGSFMEAVRTGDNDGFQQFVINYRAFTKDQTFQLCDFSKENAVWTVDVDPYSFGGDSKESVNWKEYLVHDTYEHNYKVVKDFNAESIYIKLKYGEDQLYFQLGS